MMNLQLKRSRSSDNFERPTKLSKIKENIFSFLGFTSSNKKLSERDDDNHDDDEQLQPLSSSLNGKATKSTAIKNVSNHQITAKQLSDYYDQLRRENSTLTSNLTSLKESTPTPALETEKPKNINDNDTVLSNKAESTIIQNEAKEEKEQNQEQIVPPLSTSTELSNSDKNCSNLKPLFTIDPLERANLIHLKKMLELEKYRKLRMKYIQEHTRHLKNNLNNDLNYKKCGPKLVNDISQSRKRNWNDLPEERKNKEGSFGISLIEHVEDDDDEDVEEEERNQNSLNNHNLLKKIKFNETDLSTFDTALKPKSFVPNKENEIKETSDQSINLTKPVHTISKKPVKGIDAPTVAFDFGKKKEENYKTNNDKIDSSRFRVTASSTEKPDKLSFSSGQPAVSSVNTPSFVTEKNSTSSFSFAKPIHTSKIESKPSVTFSSKNDIPSLFQQQVESKVEKAAIPFVKDDKVLNTNPSNTFNFKNNNPMSPINFGSSIINKEESLPAIPISNSSFNFGSSNNKEKEVKHSAPSFDFGMSAEKKKGDKPPVSSFDFAKSTENINDKPSFSFGQQAAAQKEDVKKGVTTPFSFESKPDSPALANSAITFDKNTATVNGRKAEPTPLFSSGIEKKDIPKPAFSFGKNSEAPKMDFGFGNTSGLGSDAVAKTTPAFNFGATAEKKNDQKPTMAFGSSNATSNIAAFNFDSNKKPVIPSVEKKDETAFGFGGSNKPSILDSEDSDGLPLKRKKISQNGSAPTVFNLNASKVQSSAFGTPNDSGTLSSTFGATINNTNNAKTGFNFGVSKSASPAPNITETLSSKNDSSKNFSFGQASTNKPADIGFGLSNTGTGNATGFGQTKDPGFGFTSNNGTATSFGQNGVNGFANNMNQNQNQSQPQAPGKIFSSISSKFTSQLPSITAGFNNNNAGFGSNSNGFGGNTNNGFGASTNGAFGSNTGFSGNTNAGFGTNAGSLSGTNSGFGNNSGFGDNSNGFGSNSHTNMNTNNMGGSSRSATPNIDFTGQQSGQIDPNAIFSGTSSATPPPHNARRKAFPRSMRNRR